MTGLTVLLVTGEYPPMPGGVGDYTANLRMALAAMGSRTVVLSSRGARGEGVSTVRRWGWPSVASVLRLAKRGRVDVIHIQYQAGAFGMHPALNAMPSLLARQFPIVTTCHDLRAPYLFPRAGRLRKSAIVGMARASDAVIVSNPADGRALANEGIGTTRIPIGPNLPPAGPVGAVARDSVAFFGFPARSKGIVELIQALESMPPPRPTLLLVGAHGEPSTLNDIVSGDEIDALAGRTGIHIERSGYLPPRAASEMLARAGAVALPLSDGASLRSGSLLAALQSGRPVVTTRPRCEADLVELANMPQLLLVDRGDRDDLRAAISRALAWRGIPAPLPRRFRWQSIATAHDALYRSVLDQRGR